MAVAGRPELSELVVAVRSTSMERGIRPEMSRKIRSFSVHVSAQFLGQVKNQIHEDVADMFIFHLSRCS